MSISICLKYHLIYFSSLNDGLSLRKVYNPFSLSLLSLLVQVIPKEVKGEKAVNGFLMTKIFHAKRKLILLV